MVFFRVSIFSCKNAITQFIMKQRKYENKKCNDE